MFHVECSTFDVRLFAPPMSPWKRFRYRLEWLAVKLLAILIPLLPRRGAHWLSQGLGSLAYFCDGRGRTTALENLRVVFGDRLSLSERRRVARHMELYDDLRLDHFRGFSAFWSAWRPPAAVRASSQRDGTTRRSAARHRRTNHAEPPSQPIRNSHHG